MCRAAFADSAPRLERPLMFVQLPSDFTCSTCKDYNGPVGRYGCEECGFYLDLDCALSIMPCEEGSPAIPQGITTKSLLVDVHEHPLTPFFTKLERYICRLCEEFVTGEGCICLASDCEFFAHQGCIRSLYYKDGSRIPRVEQDHQMFAIPSTRKCKICKLKVPGEGIGCSICKLFYHRKCIEAPDKLKYPFRRKHPLTLTVVEVQEGQRTPSYRSCGFGLADELEMFLRTSADPALRKLNLRIEDLERKLLELEMENVRAISVKKTGILLGVYACEQCHMSYKLVANIWCAYPQMVESMEKTRDAAIVNVEVEFADLEGKLLVKEKDVNRVKQQLVAPEEQLKALEES
ncbi:hypothetical protein MLD38_015547 [Melastoma candidum]|uniref:Uncharacterized protein n=1 Tax=Melastoma candidum TaxID=119954 RepID=A0ACB9RG97_9MYRT|nr:hypothetical protein MLD38_015547 [Melastoma candidum]